MRKDIRMNFAYDGQYVTFHPETNTNQVLAGENVTLADVLSALRRPSYRLVKKVAVAGTVDQKVFTFSDPLFRLGQEDVLIHRGGELLDEVEYTITYTNSIVTITLTEGLLVGSKLHFMVLRETLSPEVNL